MVADQGSATLGEAVKVTLKVSRNLHAERDALPARGAARA